MAEEKKSADNKLQDKILRTLTRGVRDRKLRYTLLTPVLTFFIALILWATQLLEWNQFTRLDGQLYNQLFEWRGPRAPHPDIVILAIDDVTKEAGNQVFGSETNNPSIQLMMNGFPFPRKVYGQITEKLLNAGAKVVAYDMLFPSPSVYGVEDDAEWAKAIDLYSTNVVIGANVQEKKDSTNQDGGTVGISLPVDSLLTSANSLTSVGFVNYWPDFDNYIRAARHQTSLEVLSQPEVFSDIQPEHTLYTSYDALAARKYDPSIPLGGWSKPRLINYSTPALGYQHHSLLHIFLHMMWKQNFKNGEFFRGKIILIGPVGNWTHDNHYTSYGFMPGVEIHANSIASILRQDYVKILNAPWIGGTLIFFMAFLTLFTMGRLKNAFAKLASIVVIDGFFLLGASLLFNSQTIVFPMAWSLIGITLTGITELTAQIIMEQLERRRVKSTLDKYVSKNVANYVLEDQNEFTQALGGKRKPVTILFSDIRSFTTMTESADEQELVKQLNEYFSTMVPLVYKTNGTLHKYIGDAIMAVWGDTHSYGTREDAVNATSAILKMTRDLKILNERWEKEGKWQSLKIGVGLNHGTVVVGNIGSAAEGAERMEFTVIGDAVNLASRLEGATKEFHTDRLIGESVAELVKDDFYLRSAGKLVVKGKTVPVAVFIPLEEKIPGENPTFDKVWLDQYEEAYQFYIKREFDKAEVLLKKCQEKEPSDYLCDRYIKEIAAFRIDPPGADWQGEFKMKDK